MKKIICTHGSLDLGSHHPTGKLFFCFVNKKEFLHVDLKVKRSNSFFDSFKC